MSSSTLIAQLIVNDAALDLSSYGLNWAHPRCKNLLNHGSHRP